MSNTAFDVLSDTDTHDNAAIYADDKVAEAEEAPAAEITAKQAAKNSMHYVHNALRERMKRAPERVKEIATKAFGESGLLHSDVTKYLETRNDITVISRLAARFHCTREEANLLLDYFALTRMIASDDRVGRGPIVL